jgi:hypothetical protein
MKLSNADQTAYSFATLKGQSASIQPEMAHNVRISVHKNRCWTLLRLF